MPAPQGTHEALAFTPPGLPLKLPGGQYLAHVPEPGAGAREPAGHEGQKMDCSTAAKVPGAQGVGALAPSGQNEPTGQGMALAWALPAGQKKPSGQGAAHAALAVVALEVPRVPGGQGSC